jgi:hypothetical protein
MAKSRLKSAEHYLKEAKRLQREAETTTDPVARQQLFTIALGYVDLAKTIEMLGETPPGR